MAGKRRTRASCLVLVAVVIVTDPSAQQSTRQLIAEMSHYLGAATRFADGVRAGLATVDSGKVRAKEVLAAREELLSVSDALYVQYRGNVRVVSSIVAYLTLMRRTPPPSAEERDEAWQRAIRTFNDVARVVSTTMGIVERSSWLNVSLSTPDREALTTGLGLSLRSSLKSRALLLDSFTSLPAPTSDAEIDQLAAMEKNYFYLTESLTGLMEDLNRVTNRLK